MSFQFGTGNRPPVLLILLTGGGDFLCTVATVWAWLQLSPIQPMWPIPGLFLVEMLLASGMGLAGLFLGWSEVLWTAGGVFLAFVVLGALSIGLLYLPAAILILAAAGLATNQRGKSLAAGALICLAAGVLQGGMMLVLIQILPLG